MAPLALAGTGYALEAQGKTAQAAAAFASVPEKYPKAMNLAQSCLDAARNFEAAGDKASARAQLERALKAGLPERTAVRVKERLSQKG
jgi:TolA-binding protein